MTTVDPAQWRAVRAALESAATGFAALLESAPAPQRRVVGRWSLADTGVHVAAIVPVYHRMLTSDGATGSVELDQLFGATTLGTVADLNRYMMPHYPVQEPAAVAAQLREDTAALLRDTADADPSAVVPWLGGAGLPVAGLCAHLLNELLLHGWDLAPGHRRPVGRAAARRGALLHPVHGGYAPARLR